MIRGASIPLASCVVAPVPSIIPESFPGTIIISDSSESERVVRVWTNDPAWWIASFDVEDFSALRAFVFVTEATDGASLVTAYPLRPRGVAFGVRGGSCTISVGAWTLDGSPVVTGSTKVNVSIAPGRPQLQTVSLQSVCNGISAQEVWFQPDKFCGAEGSPALTRWGVRFCDALRVTWSSNGGGAPRIRITRGSGGLITEPLDPWGQIDIPVDNIIRVQALQPNTVMGAAALVYR